jgi:hypothetical protein
MRLKPLATAVVISLLGTANCTFAGVVYEWPVAAAGNGHAYEVVVDTTASWNTAEASVASTTYLGSSGYLATITSPAENNFVSSILLSNQLPGRYALGGFLGGNSLPQFNWVTGEPWSYTNWSPGEPNGSGQEDVVMIYGASGIGNNSPGTWNDLIRTEQLGGGYVVEYPGPFTTPEPSATWLFGLAAIVLCTGYLRQRP